MMAGIFSTTIPSVGETIVDFLSTKSLTANFMSTTGLAGTNATDETMDDETNFTEIMSTAKFQSTSQGNCTPAFYFADPVQRVVLGSIMIVLIVFGLAGNSMVVLAVTLSRKLQTSTNAFVVNLAAADLLTCATAAFSATAVLSTDEWPLPGIVYSITAALGVCYLSSSILTLAAIAVNRFVLITKPKAAYRSIYTPKKIAAMLAFTWVYSALLCFYPFFFDADFWEYSSHFEGCKEDTSYQTKNTFRVVASVLVFPISLLILVVCYFKIYRHVTGHMKKMRGKIIEMADTLHSSNASTTQLHKNPPASFSKRQVEITKNLFYVVCAFVVCLVPYAIALMLSPVISDIEGYNVVVPWIWLLVFFNSVVNPVIYGLKHPHFKEVFRHMLRCHYHMIPEPSSCLRKMRSR